MRGPKRCPGLLGLDSGPRTNRGGVEELRRDLTQSRSRPSDAVILGQPKFRLRIHLGTANDLNPIKRNAPPLGEIVLQLRDGEVNEGKLPEPIR
jgi:hypothetical protein